MDPRLRICESLDDTLLIRKSAIRIQMITLLTDFGSADYFVPAVKGVILSINPRIRIVDLTHEIPAQDVETAAFTLGACYRNFPAGSIHVAVVDPGVGSSRRGIVVETGQRFFVGPDNGIFSYVYSQEKQVKVFQLERQEYFQQPVSSTFHGRDIFASVAAWLSRGIAPENFGDELQDYIRFEIPEPVRDYDAGRIKAAVIHVDHFGNCITNLTERELPVELAEKQEVKMKIAGRDVAQFGSHFAQSGSRDDLFAYLGSAGYWEIAVWCGSASTLLAAQRGSEIILEFQ